MHKIRPDMNIGDNLKKLRMASNMTQTQVVAQMQLYGCSVTKAIYWKMEHNKYNIRISELVAMSAIFQCDFNTLFDGLDLNDEGT